MFGPIEAQPAGSSGSYTARITRPTLRLTPRSHSDHRFFHTFPRLILTRFCTMGGSVENIIGPDAAGYIRRTRLEARLRLTDLGENKHINERFVFDAPRLVTEVISMNPGLSYRPRTN
ncbi:hypothetical protein BDV25DRAFT_160936 [Aspergillus avenaceus]|uniref:Uncharacterized protein n=1 Tax=Aspergillus avenaceus TaxID=36643 RepID=A0A5N6TM44_ASPAV|nr:hypothetical protein BDV25DRAFT_160936 [Aspergillus avenaceus]